MRDSSRQSNGEIITRNVKDESEDSDDEELEGSDSISKGSPLAVRPGIVHRLDKGTSGLLVIAKVWF